MSLKNITWPQVAIVVVMMAGTFAAHQWLGLSAGAAAGMLTTLAAFLMGRDPGKPTGGNGAPLALALAALCLSSLTACSWLSSHEALFPTPAEVACVLVQVELGNSDPIAVMESCGIDRTLENDIIAIINGGLQAKAKREAAAPK